MEAEHGRAPTEEQEDEAELPGLLEMLEANARGELHELGPGAILRGKWELLALLGEGSFGRVYEARHLKLGRPAAIKILVGHRVGPGAKQRFLEEAQLMAGLTSEHVIRATDYDELEDGTPYFVMDLVKGKSLRHWLRERLPIWRAVEIAEQILTGLVEVHRHGVVHGDIKPENVVIGEDDDEARLLDFGLAQTSAEEPEGLGGTPCYMAPEMLLKGSPATVRTDVFAVGVVLYEMLTGRLPRGHLLMDVTKIREEWKVRRRADPVLMHCKHVPEDQREALEALDKLVMEALAPDPTHRPKSAMPMLQELENLRGRLSPDAVAPTLPAEAAAAPRALDVEARTTAPFGALARDRWPVPRWAIAAGLVGVVGGAAWLAWSAVDRTPDKGAPRNDSEVVSRALDVTNDSKAAKRSLDVTEFAAAKGGILVAVPDDAGEAVTAHYDALCEALGGNRERVEGTLAVACRPIPPMDADALAALAETAEVRVVVLVGNGRSEEIVVRSTKHRGGNALLARLDGLELPKDPAAMAVAASVLRALVGARAAAGGTGAAAVEIPGFEWKEVGARWSVLAEWLRVQQGRDTAADVRQRKVLAQVLEEQLEQARSRGVDDGSAFYRDLAVLVLATSLSCAGSEQMLLQLSEAGKHDAGVRVFAMLERVSCLLDAEDASSRVQEAAEVLADAFETSGDDPCVSVEAIGLVSWIDALKDTDAGWEGHRLRLPGPQRCEPTMWSQGYAVRGDALVERGDWCGAAAAYELAYEASQSNVSALVAWPEYASKCPKTTTERRRDIVNGLGDALESGRLVAPDQRVSIAYMRWWLTRDPTDAERVANAHADVEEGEMAMIEGTASDLEDEICAGKKGDACSLRVVARPKRKGDTELLRASLGLR